MASHIVIFLQKDYQFIHYVLYRTDRVLYLFLNPIRWFYFYLLNPRKWGMGNFMSSKNVYLNYLIQSKAEPMDAMLSYVSPACVQLLSAIAVADFQGQPLTISQIMAMIHLASPGTIHRRVESLRQKGLIDLIYKGNNRRTKYIVPTAAANAYFEKMGDLLLKTLSTDPLRDVSHDHTHELACAA